MRGPRGTPLLSYSRGGGSLFKILNQMHLPYWRSSSSRALSSR